jgi:hypothetical protein
MLFKKYQNKKRKKEEETEQLVRCKLWFFLDVRFFGTLL